MRAHHFSGSKTDLAFLCQFWMRPDVEHLPRPMGLPALRGVNVHRASDRYHNGISTDDGLNDEEKALWSSLAIWLAKERPFTHSELPLLYDAENDTATLCAIGTEGERDYLGVTAMRVPVRLDLLRFDDDRGELWIVDIKTGAKANSSPAPENDQLATQAVAASRYFGVDMAKVGLVFPMKTKVHEPAWHTLDADALDVHAGKLHRALKVVPQSEPTRGSWCWRCPIGPAKGTLSTCPAWAEAAAAE